MSEKKSEIKKKQIVYLHGMLGWGNNQTFIQAQLGDYFGVADIVQTLNTDRESIQEHYPSLGKLDNIKDNAINAYYQIKGGLVDFGEKYDNDT